MPDAARPADAYTDYRFFRFVALWSSRFVIAAVAFLFWYFLFFRLSVEAQSVPIFLGTTLFISLLVSLVAALVSYMLYKRRGGRIEKTPRPSP